MSGLSSTAASSVAEEEEWRGVDGALLNCSWGGGGATVDLCRGERVVRPCVRRQGRLLQGCLRRGREASPLAGLMQTCGSRGSMSMRKQRARKTRKHVW